MTRHNVFPSKDLQSRLRPVEPDPSIPHRIEH
jgi:hypothetical protein